MHGRAPHRRVRAPATAQHEIRALRAEDLREQPEPDYLEFRSDPTVLALCEPHAPALLGGAVAMAWTAAVLAHAKAPAPPSPG